MTEEELKFIQQIQDYNLSLKKYGSKDLEYQIQQIDARLQSMKNIIANRKPVPREFWMLKNSRQGIILVSDKKPAVSNSDDELIHVREVMPEDDDGEA